MEFRSYSKTAGFTGIRCGYTVVPEELVAYDSAGKAVPLKPMWTRRQTTKFNGASYITQRGAAAIYTEGGKAQCKLVREAFAAKGYEASGGVDSPYIWVNVKGDSWEFFDALLKKANVVTTPGAGFGAAGEGFMRVNIACPRSRLLDGMQRFIVGYEAYKCTPWK